MSRYAKAIVAILGAVLTTVLATFPDSVEVQQWGAIIVSFVTAVGVYLIPNIPAPAEPAVRPLP